MHLSQSAKHKWRCSLAPSREILHGRHVLTQTMAQSPVSGWAVLGKVAPRVCSQHLTTPKMAQSSPKSHGGRYCIDHGSWISKKQMAPWTYLRCHPGWWRPCASCENHCQHPQPRQQGSEERWSLCSRAPCSEGNSAPWSRMTAPPFLPCLFGFTCHSSTVLTRLSHACGLPFTMQVQYSFSLLFLVLYILFGAICNATNKVHL